MLTYVAGGIYTIPIYKIVQRVLLFVNVKSYILPIRIHSLVRVSIDVVVDEMWCSVFDESMKYLMQWKLKQL